MDSGSGINFDERTIGLIIMCGFAVLILLTIVVGIIKNIKYKKRVAKRKAASNASSSKISKTYSEKIDVKKFNKLMDEVMSKSKKAKKFNIISKIFRVLATLCVLSFFGLLVYGIINPIHLQYTYFAYAIGGAFVFALISGIFNSIYRRKLQKLKPMMEEVKRKGKIFKADCLKLRELQKEAAIIEHKIKVMDNKAKANNQDFDLTQQQQLFQQQLMVQDQMRQQLEQMNLLSQQQVEQMNQQIQQQQIEQINQQMQQQQIDQFNQQVQQMQQVEMINQQMEQMNQQMQQMEQMNQQMEQMNQQMQQMEMMNQQMDQMNQQMNQLNDMNNMNNFNNFGM
jgi:cytochrome c biogenesis protein CcdA